MPTAYRTRYERVTDNPPSLPAWRSHHTDILLAVHRLEYATIPQLLLFLGYPPRRSASLSKTLKTLFHHGYVNRLRLFDKKQPLKSQPDIYKDTNHGRRVLEALASIPYRRLSDKVATTSNFLFHHLGATDTFNKFVLEAHAHNQSLTFEDEIHPSFSRITWPVRFRHNGEQIDTTVNADKVFAPPTPDRPSHITFIEYDTGAEPVNRSTLKGQRSPLKMYLAYAHTYRQRLLKKNFNLSSFSVLTVTNTESRVEQLSDMYKRSIRQLCPPNVFLATHIDFVIHPATSHAVRPSHIEWRNGMHQTARFDPLRSP